MISFLRQLVLKDFALKLFSLALATLLWFTISQAIDQQHAPGSALGLLTQERTFPNLPVSVMSSAQDARRFKVVPTEVEVTVRGATDVLKSLQSAELRAIVDLSGIEAARDLRKRVEVSTPAGITFIRVQPPEVRVNLAPKS